MRGHLVGLVVVAACAVALAACGSADSAEDPGGATAEATSSTTEVADDAPSEGPTAATVVSIEVEGQAREVIDSPAPLPGVPDGPPPALAAMNESAELEVLGARTVEVRFWENRCRDVARDVEVAGEGTETRLLVRVGTAAECAPDPDSDVPAMEAAVAVPYVVQVELDSELPEGGAPVVELVG